MNGKLTKQELAEWEAIDAKYAQLMSDATQLKADINKARAEGYAESEKMRILQDEWVRTEAVIDAEQKRHDDASPGKKKFIDAWNSLPSDMTKVQRIERVAKMIASTTDAVRKRYYRHRIKWRLK